MNTLLFKLGIHWVFVAVLLGYYTKWVFGALVLITLMYLYRSRDIEPFDTSIFRSPAQGVIRDIEDLGDHVNVSIYLSLLNEHTQYVPIPSVYLGYEEVFKHYEPAFSTHSENNTRVTHKFDYDGSIFHISQITGVIARRIDKFLKPYESYMAGDKIGFIHFGSRVDIKFPKLRIKQLFIRKDQQIDIMDQMFSVKAAYEPAPGSVSNL